MSAGTRLFIGISELVQPHAREGSSREPLTVTQEAALLCSSGVVLAAGERAHVEAHPQARTAARVDLGGRAVVPGFIDAHTHVVHAGERVDEFARRARGESYEEIARAGGGIISSARALAEASVEDLVRESLPRLAAMLAHGTTTVEVKSGYGLALEAEQKHLEAIRAVQHRVPLHLVPTLLAHVVPHAERTPEARANYLARFADELMPWAMREGLATALDVFVEAGAFMPDEARVLATRAKQLGLPLHLHVDQLRDGNGAALAAELGALSADHLEHTSAAGRTALAARGVVATILPGCVLFLGKGPWPQGRALRDAGCEVAIATDCNPGSSRVVDLALCGTLASTSCGLTLEEALWGITRGGARALGLGDRGGLSVGERADFVVLDHSDWRALFYRPGDAPIRHVFVGATEVWAALTP